MSNCTQSVSKSTMLDPYPCKFDSTGLEKKLERLLVQCFVCINSIFVVICLQSCVTFVISVLNIYVSLEISLK